jgi:hypothetical protein
LEKAVCEGKGKLWLEEGRRFIGDFFRDKMKEGKMYEL